MRCRQFLFQNAAKSIAPHANSVRSWAYAFLVTPLNCNYFTTEHKGAPRVASWQGHGDSNIVPVEDTSPNEGSGFKTKTPHGRFVCAPTRIYSELHPSLFLGEITVLRGYLFKNLIETL
jgi:hypothetical protein